ncbi:MAG: tetratricopeptide repeat protein [Candidatus Goldbacteria bacterium]|nr:tetratricopeptide repeat protein [Candidatus Goldiibacteriota bacterium]
MLKKSSYKNNSQEIITNFEILTIVLIFSFILYILFPNDKIINYAISEKNNIELAEIYLKNLHKKYPQKPEIFFGLVEMYLKNNKINEASELLSQKKFKNSEIDFKIQILQLKIKILNTREYNEKTYKEIYNFLIKNANRLNDEYIQIVYDFNKKLINSVYQDPCKFMIDFFNSNTNDKIRKKVILNFIREIKENSKVINCYHYLRNFEEFALNDDELSYHIIKLYLEAGKPDLAADFAYKVMKNKKIL